MDIFKASEDYLEAILMIQEQKGSVHAIDLAKQLNVSKPTVSYTVKRLREAGYITITNDNSITLATPGMNIAVKMYERHKLLTQFFLSLGVDEATAAEDACKVEHDLSAQTFDAICAHVNKKNK